MFIVNYVQNNYMNKEKYIKFVIINFSILFIFIVAGTAFYVYKNNAESGEKNTVTLLKNEKETSLLINKLDTNNNSQAVFNSFDGLAKTETDKNKAEVLKLYAGASLVNLDRNAGTEYYIKIANDTTNSNINRAYAMTQIAQYASGDGNPELLKVFFSDASSTKKMSKDEINLAVNKKILELYPMNIALAKVARFELKKSPSKEVAQMMYDTYMPQIASTTKIFDQAEGLSHFTPQAYLATALFLRSAEMYGVSTTTEVRSYFDRAHSSSLAFNQQITKQFIMLGYLDYLLSRNLQADAQSIMVRFAAENPTPMIVTNLKATHGADYPSIVSYVNKSVGAKNATSTLLFVEKWSLLVK